MSSAISRASHAGNGGHALRCWQEWEIAGRERRIIMCVETGLELRPGFPGFDPEQLEALVDEATKLMHASASPIDLIRIIPQH
jgi:hypothetical protein